MNATTRTTLALALVLSLVACGTPQEESATVKQEAAPAAAQENVVSPIHNLHVKGSVADGVFQFVAIFAAPQAERVRVQYAVDFGGNKVVVTSFADYDAETGKYTLAALDLTFRAVYASPTEQPKVEAFEKDGVAASPVQNELIEGEDSTVKLKVNCLLTVGDFCG